MKLVTAALIAFGVFRLGDQARAATDEQGRLTCGALLRQLVVSPVSFREVSSRIAPTASPGLFDVQLRFDSANQFNAVMRNVAVCKFSREADLPYMIEFEKETFGLRQIEALWELHTEEMKSKVMPR
jgi:hypothetical protein